jgi:hypothetical protein
LFARSDNVSDTVDVADGSGSFRLRTTNDTASNNHALLKLCIEGSSSTQKKSRKNITNTVRHMNSPEQHLKRIEIGRVGDLRL